MIRHVPLVLFALFAVYWSAWDLWYGLWVALVPSLLIAAWLGVAAVRRAR